MANAIVYEFSPPGRRGRPESLGGAREFNSYSGSVNCPCMSIVNLPSILAWAGVLLAQPAFAVGRRQIVEIKVLATKMDGEFTHRDSI